MTERRHPVSISREEFLHWLRTELPALLREDPAFHAQVVGTLTTVLASKEEFTRVLEEIRLLREDFNRRFEAAERRFEVFEQRFEAMDRRFEALERRFEEVERRFEEVDRRFEEVDRRFEAVDRRFEALEQELIRLREDFNRRFELAERRFEVIENTLAAHSALLQEHTRLLMVLTRDVRALQIAVGALGHRMGINMEDLIRQVIEDFSGLGPLTARQLILTDDTGELYGVPGSPVEFDAYVHNGQCFLVEVKSHADAEAVYQFARKVTFARPRLSRACEPVLIASTVHAKVPDLASQLGIRLITFLPSPETDTAA